jgi:molybdopterin-guanine dinucleotide biosynthesis protein A
MICSQVSDSEYLLVVPCDGPFLPNNLVSELYTQITSEDADIACVRYQKVNQTTFSLWHRRGLPAIESALVKNNNGGFKPLLSELTTTYLDWPEEEINPFFNINTPDDLSLAEAIICR